VELAVLVRGINVFLVFDWCLVVGLSIRGLRGALECLVLVRWGARV